MDRLGVIVQRLSRALPAVMTATEDDMRLLSEDVPYLLSELRKYKLWYEQAANDCLWAENRVDELEKEIERLKMQLGGSEHNET